MGCVVGLRCWGLLGNDVTLYRVLGSLKKKRGYFRNTEKMEKKLSKNKRGDTDLLLKSLQKGDGEI